MITWVLDQHVDRVRNAPTPFIQSARQRQHLVYGLRNSLIPKPIDLSGIKISGPTIVRGSHGFVNYVQRELDAVPGGFLHDTNFQLSTYATILKGHCLNDDFQIVEYGDFDKITRKQDVFVKPLEEMKRFSGVVVKANQTIEQAHIEKYKKWLCPSVSCKMVVSTARVIRDEYRVVVVDGKAITGSTYDLRTISGEILDFVDEITKIWNPIDVYVVDVAMTDGGYKVIEYNQFGTSAMYACDQDKIIDSIEKYLR